jgi:hypothetical protein
LTDPPDGIGDKLEATRLVKLVCRSDETKITFINQVGKWNALMLVLLGNGDNSKFASSKKKI